MDHLELNKIIEAITKPYQDEIVVLKSNLVASLKKARDSYSSDQINEIAAALSKAQGDYDSFGGNRKGHYGKYADLFAVLEAVRPSLTKNNLAFYQYTELLDGGQGALILHTLIIHSSGQWISSRSRLTAGKLDQEYGKHLTFQRRYAALALLGLYLDRDKDDDDGQEEVDKAIITAPAPDYVRPKPTSETLSKHQYDELILELDGWPQMAEDIMRWANIKTLADLPERSWRKTIDKVRENKLIYSQSKINKEK